jgi:hypothetical protein
MAGTLCFPWETELSVLALSAYAYLRGVSLLLADLVLLNVLSCPFYVVTPFRAGELKPRGNNIPSAIVIYDGIRIRLHDHLAAG